MRAGKKYVSMWGNIIAIDSSFLPYMKLEVENGYMPSEGDSEWILFGSLQARMFYDEKKPLTMKERDAMWNPDYTKPPKVDLVKEKITVQNPSAVYLPNPSTGWWEEKQLKGKLKKFTLDKVGVLKRVENNYGWDEHEYSVYMDYNIAVELVKEMEKLARVKAKDSQLGQYDQVRIKVKDIKTSETVQKKLMEEQGVMVNYGLADMRDEMQKTQNTMQMILGGIGAMSLIVAAIGIANTMFMSIYERTKEIGVMKVLGCPLFGIKSMFLFEASIIGFCGGILGSGISVAGSYAMNNVESFKKALGNMSSGGMSLYSGGMEQGDISVIPLWLIVAAIAFATVVGFVSGYLPARRATKISALEAIRNE
jgi:ABC-type antimicrobial peptide transport system permease subunit